MSAINFSVEGTRWRAVPVTRETLTAVPLAPGPGVLFTSADGEIRFLRLDADTISPVDLLQSKTNTELGVLVQHAKPLLG